MIDTNSLKEGDICLVNSEDEFGFHYSNLLCIFVNGVFQNIEEDHTYEVYGSSVYKFKKIQTATRLHLILSDKIKLQSSSRRQKNE